MNKKALIRIGKFGVLSGFLIFLIFFVLFPLLSSLAIQKENYVLGEKVKIDLREKGECNLKIISPSTSFRKDCNNEIILFIPSEIGTYEGKFICEEESGDFGFGVFESEQKNKEELIPLQEFVSIDKNTNLFKSSNESLRDVFSLTQDVEINFEKKERSRFSKVVDYIQPSFEGEVYDSFGKKTDFEVEINQEGEEIKVIVKKENSLKPGIYTLHVENWLEEYNQEFIWGLVSLNTKKSIYHPLEIAEFEIIVLDSLGRGVCNAPVLLEVTSPSGETFFTQEVLSGEICGVYFSSYLTHEEGEYSINVQTFVGDYVLNFSTSFFVQKNYDYEIIRNAQSVIDPTKENFFNVGLQVESLKNESFLEVKEFVPRIFEIFNTDAEISIEEKFKVLKWEINSSSINLEYSYSVPLVWPYLYELGPLEVNDFSEARSWYVAVDPDVLGFCIDIINCVDLGSSAICYCSESDSSNNVYLGTGLSTKNSDEANVVLDLSNSSLVPDGASILSAILSVEYYVQAGMSSCDISYSTDDGASWISLDSDCTDQITESTVEFDLSSLNETQLENIFLNITSVKQSNQGNPLYLYVDYVELNISYVIQGNSSVTLNWPSANYNLNNSFVEFNFTPSSPGGIYNCSLWDNSTGSFVLEIFNQTPIVNGSYNYLNNTYSSNGAYLWNVECCDEINGCFFSNLNRTIVVDTIAPDVSLVSPSNDSFSDSSYGIDFVYNVTDTNSISDCSLVLDGGIVDIDYSVTKSVNQTFSYPVESGIHSWSINCSDEAGNEDESEIRIINVSFSPSTWDKRWYETFTSNFTSSAEIYLGNIRDSEDNYIDVSVPSKSSYKLVEAVSPFMVNNGAEISSGTISFSAFVNVARTNRGYLTWKVYVTNSSGDALICQSGDDSTSGTRMSSTSGTWTGSCNNTNNLWLSSTDRLKLILNVWNDDTTSLSVSHYWDNLRLSYVEFANFTSLGNLLVDMVEPTIDLNINSGQSFNVSCNVNCTAGECLDADVFVQYNTSSGDWVNIGSSGNLILYGFETNPHSLGDVNTNGTITNFTIEGSLESSNNIRCVGLSDYSNVNGTTTKQVIVTLGNQAPTVVLTNPDDESWFDSSNVVLYYNASDEIGFKDCSLYINGIFNQSNSSVILNNEINNFTINGWEDAEYNWTVNCTDNGDLSSQPPERTFYIDTVFPTLNLIYPAEDEIVYESDINFNFSVEDNMDLSLTCNLTIDSVVEGLNFAVTNGTFTQRLISDLSVGNHLWNITCGDNAGNLNSSETKNFSIVDLPPTITLITSDEYWFNTNNFVLEYNVSDNNYLTSCDLYINGIFNQSNSSVILNNEVNNFTINGWEDAEYNWTVNCTDNGDLSSQPPERTFYIDTVFPTLNLIYPAEDEIVYESDINFNFSVEDNMDLSLTCNLTIDSVVEGLNFAVTNGTFTQRLISDLTDGEKPWNVTCVDNAGNLNSSEMRMFNVSVNPEVVLNTENDSAFSSPEVNLFYTPTDNTGLESCDLYLNGVFNQSNSSEILEGELNNFSLNLESGEYNWSILCTDLVGLQNMSVVYFFIVDLAYPLINLESPFDEADIYDSLVYFNYSVEDDLDVNLNCNLTVNSVVENSTLALNGTTTSVGIVFIQGGIKYWNVTCTDDAGNLNSSETRNFTLYLPPKVNLISPENEVWFNTGNVFLEYNVSDDNGDIINSILILNGVFNQSNSSEVLNNEMNNFSLEGLSDGEYFWNVNVTDSEDLVGTGEERLFYIDTEKPLILINFPIQDEIVTDNNFSLNFSVKDNLASNLTCNISVDDFNEFEDEIFLNNTENVKYLLRNDGNYTWYVECVDLANNYNLSQEINFTIEAPPNVILDSPANGNRTTASSISFSYTPYDSIGITQCDFYLDEFLNSTDTNIERNELNSFLISGIEEGQHNWTVSCTDSDSNDYSPSVRVFYRDLTAPEIVLENPLNNSGIYFGNGGVNFIWKATDLLDNVLRCDLIIDGVVEKENILVTSGISNPELITGISEGYHEWNVSCWDQVGNINNSETWNFNFTYPDFLVNSTSLLFNETFPKEGENVLVNVTAYNLGGVGINNIIVSLFDGDPDLGGVQIGNNKTLNLSAYGEGVVNFSWSADMGESEIFVLIDPPLESNGSYDEWNESNNEISKNISVGSWHFFYGSISSDSSYGLLDNLSDSLILWNADNFEEGNIFVSDSESIISWSSLSAIGKNISGENTTNDFIEIDSILSTTSFNDSVYSLYTNSGMINNLSDFLVFGKNIFEVPIVESINNSNFITGILWDGADDLDGEFSSVDKEDLIFVAKINKDQLGAYGVYDYELRVPAKLRDYISVDSSSAVFYLELD